MTEGVPKRAILDTSVLIAPNPGRLPGDLAISVVSLAELHFGVLVAKTDEARADRLVRLGEIESQFAAVPVDTAVARAYSRLAAALSAYGRQPRSRAMDLLIAATAAAHGAALYTHNIDDFTGLDKLVEVIAV